MAISTATHVQHIAAPAGAVWDVISAAGYLEECHPFCAANPVDEWPGVGSQDRIEYYNGRKITRHFIAWEEGAGYDIEITDANGPVANVVWRLADEGAGSTLTITITPQMPGHLPTVVRWARDTIIVRPMLVRYLRSVMAGIEWRVTTGRPVQRNQFGAHRWFSPAA